VEFLKALLPTIGVMIFFWIGIRALVRADRNERAAQTRFEERQRVAEARKGQAGPDRQ
jgi:hypothetical protein